MLLSVRWRKANTSPVCFGARNNQFGRFNAPISGKLAAVKLVHLYGYVRCSTDQDGLWSFWGCGKRLSVKNHVDVVITRSTNQIILPPSQFFRNGPGKWSEIPGYNSNSPRLVMSSMIPLLGSQPTLYVRAGEPLRLWYGEDLVGYTENDNGGKVCCDVHVLTVSGSVGRQVKQLQASWEKNA